MSASDEPSHVFKVIVIGDANVGKTNILSRFTKNHFDDGAKPTVGVEFSSKKLTISGKTVKLQIWDTAGQERYKAVSSNYYKGTHGVVVVYDITKKKTFENVTKWLTEVQNNASQDTSVILVGNKKDLDSMREVSTEEAQSLSTEHKLYFLETSALDNSDKMIEKVFSTLCEDILVKREADEDEPVTTTGTATVNLMPPPPKDGEANKDAGKKGCC